ncbi:MAG TPA: DciA family protein, partial [Patescibacteria group bacterium]|nr:DciA family protein [Patescibacteria group bacterium]
MNRKSENKLGDLLGAAIGRAGIMRQVGAAVIVQAGNEALVELFDDGILEFAQCRSFEDGRVSVACTHAALAQEIQMNNKKLIESITSSVPGAM